MSFILSSIRSGTSSIFNQVLSGLKKTIPTTLNSATNNVIQTRNLGYINRMMLKDIKRRELLRKYAPERIKLQTIKANEVLPKAVKELARERLTKMSVHSTLLYVHDRCGMTSKAGGVLSRWRLSRIMWRLQADYNHMSGVTRAVWGSPTKNSAMFVYRRHRPTWFDLEGKAKRKVYDERGNPKYVEFKFIGKGPIEKTS